MGEDTKILVTGSEGYIGTVMMPMLLNEGYDVTGLDVGFFADSNLTKEELPDYPLLKKDVRDVTAEDLKGFDAVIHLAALCNDPLGNVNEAVTLDINHKGSVNMAKAAKEAGVKRFLFSSSCSLYGASDKVLTEDDEANPQTPYGKSKILAEKDISGLADDSFSPVFLRNATAFGISPRMRFDIVVNNLSGFAKTTGKIQILGDGTPWRPLVHVKDICAAFIAALKADKDVIHNQAFNVGDGNENYQIKSIAEHVKKRYADCVITIAQKKSSDTRNYAVSFEKLNNQLKQRSAITLDEGILEIADVYDSINLDDSIFESVDFTRLKRIKQLMDAGKLGDDFRWKE